MWKMVWRFLKKLGIKPSHDPAIPLLGIYPEETKIGKDTSIPLFIAALFTIARTWKKPRCPLTDEWIKMFWYLYTMEYSAQSLSHVWPFATPWIAARQASLYLTNSQSLLKLMSIVSVMPSSHLILCHSLLLCPIPPSIRVFSNESTLHVRWPKYWSFSFSISPSNEHPGLISFRMDWLDLLAVQGTLKSLLQHHIQKHQFFSTQLSSQSNPHIHTWPLEKP